MNILLFDLEKNGNPRSRIFVETSFICATIDGTVSFLKTSRYVEIISPMKTFANNKTTARSSHKMVGKVCIYLQ